MKRRPSSSFLVCAAVAVVLGGIGLWFLSKLKAFPMHQWFSLSFSEILHGEKQDHSGYTPEQISAARKLGTDLKQQLLTEFPDLAIQEKPVPDDRNGFRLLYELTDGTGEERMRVTGSVEEILQPSTPWDPVTVRETLESHGELVARIESIAALPDRSSAGMTEEYNGFFSSEELKICADFLMVKARLAAEAKDEAEALRLTKAALNLASHLDQVEAPNFYIATVALLIDLSANESVIARLLPALGRDADLAKWRDVLASRPDYTPDGLARIARSEWNHLMDQVMVTDLLEAIKLHSPQETESLYRTIAFQSDFRIRSLAGQKTSMLLSLPKPPLPGVPLSASVREVLDGYWVGSEEWGKGYARAASVRAMTLAALDLLILEKSGTILTADSVSKTTLEPLTGQAFLFDPVTRTLTAPPTLQEGIKVDPLKLP